MIIDNVIIGSLVDGLTPLDLGIQDDEITVHMTLKDAKNLDLFLPRILVSVGLFKTTSEIKRIDKVRVNSKKIKDVDSLKLWRTLDHSEVTEFKVGKKTFWLLVGDLQTD